jgi:hypothetical protein
MDREDAAMLVDKALRDDPTNAAAVVEEALGDSSEHQHRRPPAPSDPGDTSGDESSATENGAVAPIDPAGLAQEAAAAAAATATQQAADAAERAAEEDEEEAANVSEAAGEPTRVHERPPDQDTSADDIDAAIAAAERRIRNAQAKAAAEAEEADEATDTSEQWTQFAEKLEAEAEDAAAAAEAAQESRYVAAEEAARAASEAEQAADEASAAQTAAAVEAANRAAWEAAHPGEVWTGDFYVWTEGDDPDTPEIEVSTIHIDKRPEGYAASRAEEAAAEAAAAEQAAEEAEDTLRKASEDAKAADAAADRAAHEAEQAAAEAAAAEAAAAQATEEAADAGADLDAAIAAAVAAVVEETGMDPDDAAALVADYLGLEPARSKRPGTADTSGDDNGDDPPPATESQETPSDDDRDTLGPPPSVAGDDTSDHDDASESDSGLLADPPDVDDIRNEEPVTDASLGLLGDDRWLDSTEPMARAAEGENQIGELSAPMSFEEAVDVGQDPEFARGADASVDLTDMMPGVVEREARLVEVPDMVAADSGEIDPIGIDAPDTTDQIDLETADLDD